MFAIKDNNGMSLIEVMISLLVTMILFLALMQTSLLSISQNTRNSIRDEAVSVATERMREARNMDFDLMATDAGIDNECKKVPKYLNFTQKCPGGIGRLVDRNVRNIPGPGVDEDLFDFCTCMIVPPQAAGVTDFKQVNIFVGWEWSGEEYSHAVSSLVRRP
jgi:type II secretory pathway pseudopilin PulG